MRLALFLGWRELRHDWISAACFVAALIGVLGPMLLLLALKNGVIGTMVDRLVDDPANREIIAVGAGAHEADFFQWLASRTDVAFVSPSTRTINALADAIRNETGRQTERSVPLIVSGAGDPLLSDPPPGVGTVWLSAPLAASLQARVGTEVEIFIGRQIDGRDERAHATLIVAGIAKAETYGRPAVFLSLPDMVAIERFRDDASVLPNEWRDRVDLPAEYASFRLYAAGLESLAPLIGALAEKGVDARARAENAVLLLRFRDNLDIIYIGIACLAYAGFWAAMSANLRGMVERRRSTASLLRLTGLGRRDRLAVPLVQSLTLIGLGTLATLAIILPAIWVLNAGFATEPGEAIARLGLSDIVLTCVIGGITALTSALWAMSAVSRITSAEVLRHA